MAERFYVNTPPSPGLFTLTGPEAHHLAAVCRVQVGETIVLFCGDGGEWAARVVGVERHAVQLDVGERREPTRERLAELIVAAPLPKGDRASFLIEKLTELGVTRFIPLLTTRTVVQPGAGKTEKLRRGVIEASKQCGRNRLMVVDEPRAWREVAVAAVWPPLRCLADPAGTAVPPLRGQAAIVAVGPEGGMTPDEVALARDHGWQLVGLGPRILRVETAAVMLAALAN
jgi:16S rRNA (uracil1498-N3)-methyltransferase